jgi:hypothetical protein
MLLNEPFSLPEWKDRFRGDDQPDNLPALIAGKALYEQWREVFKLVMTYAAVLAADPDEEGSQEQWTKRLIHENAMIVAPKIVSASHSSLYVLQMENVAVIRFNCRQMMEQVSYAALSGQADASYKEVIEEAMEQFRSLFKAWVTTFRRDEYEVEWACFFRPRQ